MSPDPHDEAERNEESYDLEDEPKRTWKQLVYAFLRPFGWLLLDTPCAVLIWKGVHDLQAGKVRTRTGRFLYGDAAAGWSWILIAAGIAMLARYGYFSSRVHWLRWFLYPAAILAGAYGLSLLGQDFMDQFR